MLIVYQTPKEHNKQLNNVSKDEVGKHTYDIVVNLNLNEIRFH